MTGFLQLGSNSVLLASAMPQTLRAYSMTAIWKPRQRPEVRHLVFAGVADALDLAFGAADAEPAGHDDAVAVAESAVDVGGVDRAWCRAT